LLIVCNEVDPGAGRERIGSQIRVTEKEEGVLIVPIRGSRSNAQ
jgi:hypothetical protein